MKIKYLIWLILLSSLLSCTKETRASRPNFIIIFADDLGYGDLGCYGHPTIKTPHLDKMAQEGMKLTQFYTAASLCTPSRAGLLTGKLPVRNGMTGKRGVLFPDSAGGLPDSETTIAQVLKTIGYKTACIGKWHLGHLPKYLPINHGFDYYFGIPYSNDMAPEQSNWDYAKKAFPPTPLIEGIEVIETEPDQSQLTKRYTTKAIDFIEKNRTHPFFLYLPHTFPHVPLYVDKENTGRSKRGIYGDVVEVLDWSVGEILNSLKEYHLAENTFVLFTSDNGPWGWAGINGGSAGLLRGAKGSPWEGGFRVPAIAWMPGTIPANTSSDAIATALDVFPTFMEMAGLNYQNMSKLDGSNIWATFTQQKQVQDQVFYYRNEQLVALRKGPWKLFLLDPNPWNDEIQDNDLPLLYNVDEDPSEKFNVAKDKPDVVKELEALAAKHLGNIVKVPSQLEDILPEFRTAYDKYNRQN